MDITVVGAGPVGRALMERLAGGHTVTLAARDPGADSVVAAREQLDDRIDVRAVPDALAGADAVLLAIPGGGVTEFIEAYGTALDGRLVIDATNDLRADGPLNHVADWQRLAPGAVVARAFCSLGWENIAAPVYSGIAATLFWCGPDGEAGGRVEAIGRHVGLDPVRIGGLEAADTLDGLARLWFQLAFAQGMGRRLGFRLLRD